MPEQDITTASRAAVPFRTIAHFYDADDPSPEERRELSGRAEEQIFHEVLDAPKGPGKSLCDQIEISLPAADLTPGRSSAIIAATRSHFRFRADEVQRDMKLTQRVGLREFRLTLAVCIPCFIGIAICSQFRGDPLAEVIGNVLVIFCWVTIWQPFQSLVFDRWTQSETAKVYRKIAEMEIRVRPA
jgi:hypothetical protein